MGTVIKACCHAIAGFGVGIAVIDGLNCKGKGKTQEEIASVLWAILFIMIEQMMLGRI